MKMRLRSIALAAAASAMAPVPFTPALAQFAVFDGANYAQNLVQAARSLEQINHQIQSLQNQAAMLQNMARNLQRIDFPQLGQMTSNLQKIDQLMGQARGINFQVDRLEGQFSSLFPGSGTSAASNASGVAGAQARLGAAMSALQQTMTVQAQVVENVKQDAALLAELAAKSQNAEGSLQAQQATNQLLALGAKQQLQLQSLMATEFRSQAIERARRAQAESDAQAATRRFLGSGTAYTPR